MIPTNRVSQFENPQQSKKKEVGPHQQTTQYYSLPQNILPYQVQNIDCHKQLAIPIIQSLAEQNQTIKDQFKRLGTQMKVLNSLTKDLLNQNQKLRRHFHNRTLDVAKLVFTMQNNVQQDITDHKHLSHLLKQSNCFLIKQIEQLIKHDSLIFQENIMISNDLKVLNQRNFDNQQNILNKMQAKLKNTYNSDIVNQLQEKFNKLLKNQKNLLNQINQLTYQSSQLQKNVMMTSRNSFFINQDNRKDKSLYSSEIAVCLKNLTKLKEQKIGLQTTAQNQKRINDQMEINNKKLSQKLLTLIKKKQSLNLDFDQTNNINKRAGINIIQIKNKIHQSGISLHKKIQEKQQLQNNIRKLRSKIRNDQNKTAYIKDQKRSQHEKEIRSIRQKIRGIQKNAQGEILLMKKQEQIIQNYIQDAKKQFNSLQDDINSYQDLINGLENPIQEIQKINLSMKLKRQPLAQRN